MAAAATNGDAAAASLDSIKPPPGIIIPPPGEIREVIEKTAGYVVRGGSGIESRLRENQGSNPKFSFVMSHSDPYNPYYEWRKEEYRSGRGTAVAAGRAGEAAPAAKEEPKGPPKPPDYSFSARMPRINQMDLEIVRLTALFVARNGRPFMTSLAQREVGNPQFQFLIPNHTFHNFFQHLVDQYGIIIKEGGAGGEGTRAQHSRMADLQKSVDDKFAALARAKQRAEYAKWLGLEKLKKEEEEEKEKEEFARIDWNDFVVVETIVFTDSDETANLPPPTTLNDIQYASLEEKNKVSISSNLRIEEAFPFDDTTYNAYPQPSQSLPVHPAQPQPQRAAAPLPQYSAPPPASQQPAAPGQVYEETSRIQEREEARQRMQQAQSDARSGAPVKIKENYIPRAAAKAASKYGAAQMALCPNCKQQIPLNELEQHMRIEMLDPRWKEQKAKAESRYATTNLSTVDVANNLKRLASQRTDIFDEVTGLPITEEEEARRKKAAVNSFDGNFEGQGQHVSHLQNLNVGEQIKAIHQKFAAEQQQQQQQQQR